MGGRALPWVMKKGEREEEGGGANQMMEGKHVIQNGGIKFWQLQTKNKINNLQNFTNIHTHFT